MYAMVMMAALAAPGCGHGGCGYGNGFGDGYGFFGYGFGVYAHGYGDAFPSYSSCGGQFLPPSWPDDPTPDAEWRTWFAYVKELDGDEKEDMTRIWFAATPEARRKLLAKLPPLKKAADDYRARVEKERSEQKKKEQNRPLNEDEIQAWEAHIGKLMGDKLKDAQEKWKKADNRGRRLLLQEARDSE
jgi:hypothetical protein